MHFYVVIIYKKCVERLICDFLFLSICLFLQLCNLLILLWLILCFTLLYPPSSAWFSLIRFTNRDRLCGADAFKMLRFESFNFLNFTLTFRKLRSWAAWTDILQRTQLTNSFSSFFPGVWRTKTISSICLKKIKKAKVHQIHIWQTPVFQLKGIRVPSSATAGTSSCLVECRHGNSTKTQPATINKN